MNEINCENCRAACCKGVPLLVMQLTADELEFMRRSGNRFLTIANPVDHDRDNVIYPVSMRINKERLTYNWLAEAGNEYEPLPANYGRYALLGACKNLRKDENGWEYCGVYDERPGVCRDFEVASPKCQLLRIIHKVDIPSS